MKIKVVQGTKAHSIYGKTDVTEEFTCNYELNPAFEEKLQYAGLVISGVGENGEARIIELTESPFFLATGFVPQMISTAEKPHPLITAFLKAASEREAK